MKKRLWIEALLVVILLTIPCVAWAISEPAFSNVRDRETIEYTDYIDDDLTIKWKKVNGATSYDVWALVLDGNPDPGSNSEKGERIDGGGWNIKKNSIPIELESWMADHWLKVVVRAVGSGETSKTSTVYLWISSEYPSVRISSPSDGAVYTVGDSVSLKIQCERYHHFYYRLNCNGSTVLQDTRTRNLSDAVTLNQPGSYELYVVATTSKETVSRGDSSANGKRTERTIRFTVQEKQTVTAPPAPTIRIEEPGRSQYSVGDWLPVRVSGTNYDHFFVSVTRDGELVKNYTEYNTLDTSLYLEQAGSYQVYAVATNSAAVVTTGDASANGQRAEAWFSFTVVSPVTVTQAPEPNPQWDDPSEEDFQGWDSAFNFENETVTVTQAPEPNPAWDDPSTEDFQGWDSDFNIENETITITQAPEAEPVWEEPSGEDYQGWTIGSDSGSETVITQAPQPEWEEASRENSQGWDIGFNPEEENVITQEPVTPVPVTPVPVTPVPVTAAPVTPTPTPEPAEITVIGYENGRQYYVRDVIPLMVTGRFDHFYLRIERDGQYVDDCTLFGPSQKNITLNDAGWYKIYIVATNSTKVQTTGDSSGNGDRAEWTVEFQVAEKPQAEAQVGTAQQIPEAVQGGTNAVESAANNQSPESAQISISASAYRTFYVGESATFSVTGLFENYTLDIICNADILQTAPNRKDASFGLTFPKQGQYTIMVTGYLDGTSASDSVDLVVIQSEHPRLSVTKPMSQSKEEYVNDTINRIIWEDRAQNKNLAVGKAVVFMFEGAGQTDDTGVRQNCLCVVVKNNAFGMPEIVFEDNCSSTIPDRPKDTTSNKGDAVPTVQDGMYNILTVNHLGEYAALHVDQNGKGVPVVRFSAKKPDGEADKISTQINIHHRGNSSGDGIYATGTPNSAGCFLIGSVANDHAKFREFISDITGIDYSKSNAKFANEYADVGMVVVDRTLAQDYLISLYGDAGARKIMGDHYQEGKTVSPAQPQAEASIANAPAEEPQSNAVVSTDETGIKETQIDTIGVVQNSAYDLTIKGTDWPLPTCVSDHEYSVNMGAINDYYVTTGGFSVVLPKNANGYQIYAALVREKPQFDNTNQKFTRLGKQLYIGHWNDAPIPFAQKDLVPGYYLLIEVAAYNTNGEPDPAKMAAFALYLKKTEYKLEGLGTIDFKPGEYFFLDHQYHEDKDSDIRDYTDSNTGYASNYFDYWENGTAFECFGFSNHVQNLLTKQNGIQTYQITYSINRASRDDPRPLYKDYKWDDVKYAEALNEWKKRNGNGEREKNVRAAIIAAGVGAHIRTKGHVALKKSETGHSFIITGIDQKGIHIIQANGSFAGDYKRNKITEAYWEWDKWFDGQAQYIDFYFDRGIDFTRAMAKNEQEFRVNAIVNLVKYNNMTVDEAITWLNTYASNKYKNWQNYKTLAEDALK